MAQPLIYKSGAEKSQFDRPGQRMRSKQRLTSVCQRGYRTRCHLLALSIALSLLPVSLIGVHANEIILPTNASQLGTEEEKVEHSIITRNSSETTRGESSAIVTREIEQKASTTGNLVWITNKISSEGVKDETSEVGQLTLTTGSSGNEAKTGTDVQAFRDFVRDNQTNGHPEEGVNDQPFRYTLVVLAYALVVLVSLIGNLFVVLVIISKRRTRTTVNIFIANLAFSDLLMTVLNIPFTTARIFMEDWIFGSFLCHVVPFIQATSVYVSTLTMCFIAVDRFRAILQPMRRRISSKIASSVAIAAIWIIAMFFSLPFLLFNRVIESDPFAIETFTIRTYTTCRVVYPEPQDLYIKSINVITFLLQFGIPFTIMVSLYTRIGVKIWSRATIGATTLEQETRQLKAKKRTILMLLLVAIVFACCWLPYNLYYLLKDFGVIHYDLHFQIAVHWLAMSSVCYNPFIYFWLNRRFQSILRSGVQRLCSNCYCQAHTSGCTCCGFTCLCHQHSTDHKLPPVSSPTSPSSHRIPGTDSSGSARPNQAYNLMDHKNLQNKRLGHGIQKFSDHCIESDTGFNNSNHMIRETVSECTREDVIYSLGDGNHLRRGKHSSPNDRKSSNLIEREALKLEKVRNFSSAASLDNSGRSRKLLSPDRDLIRIGTEGKSLLKTRNHHRQEQMRKHRNPRSLFPGFGGAIFSASRQSLSSASSVASGLNHHHNHLICHYKGMKQCNHQRPSVPHDYDLSNLCKGKRHTSDRDIVLSSL